MILKPIEFDHIGDGVPVNKYVKDWHMWKEFGSLTFLAMGFLHELENHGNIKRN